MLAYFDCFSGISGDMSLGALVDAGLPVDLLRDELRKLPVSGYELTAETLEQHGLRGTGLRVRVAEDIPQPHRHLSDILEIVERSTLSKSVQARASAVFRKLAVAEAHVHGTSIEEVHFHEVGAVDAIVDVVGVAIGLDHLGVDRVYASSLPTGSGTVQSAHGLLPVPAPATLELLRAARAPIRASSAQTELVTPTGAAILAALATFEQPPLQLRAVGHGFGQKRLPWPNVLRVWLGEATGAAPPGFETDTVTVIEANVDDMTPEALGATMTSLLGAGALDVFFTPIQMKKDRPATKLTVLAAVGRENDLSARILRETTSLGVRMHTTRRLKCQRWQETVETPWGPVRVKVKGIGDDRYVAPEYDDCLARSRDAGVPFAEVYDVARRAAGG